MRRKPWTRVAGTFLASWFTLAAGEHAPLNPCPMHGGLALLSAAAPAIAHADSHVQDDVVPAQSSHDNHGDGECSCTGDCAAQQLSPPPVDNAGTILVPVGISGPVGVSEVVDLPTATPFLRPFANGPPQLRIG